MSHEEMSQTVALIGAGYWGKNIARNLYELGALRTICDVNEALLDKYQELYPGTKLTTNIKHILDDDFVSEVMIAAPAPAHFSLAKQVLFADKDLYVEKPLCLSQTEGKELVDLAEKRNRILMVGHILQYHPCVNKIQTMLKNGELGRLQYIVSNRLNLGKIQTQESALWSYAPHDISVILSLCSHRLPLQVRCNGGAFLSEGIADVSLTTMTFADNIRAHIYVSWLNPYKEQKLVVVGSTGMLVFDDTKPWDDKLVLYRDPVTWTHGKIPIENKQEGENIDVPQSEPLRNECEHFLKCCRTRTVPKTDGQEGMRVLKVLQAADISLKEDGEVKEPHKEYHIPLGTVHYQAHPTVVIDHGAEIGRGTKIWHFSHIMTDSIIGPSCNIGQNVVVGSGVKLGRNVKVQNNVSIYSGVTCEDDVFLGPSMVFTNIMNPRCEVSRKNQYKATLVKKGATIGANATILCGLTLGEYCFIGAGAVVTKNVKPYALVTGNPGKQVGWMSRYGERLDLPLRSIDGEEITAICPATNQTYSLKGNTVSLVKDVASERAAACKTRVLAK